MDDMTVRQKEPWLKEKLRHGAEWVRKKGEAVYAWGKGHPEVLMTFVPLLVNVAMTIGDAAEGRAERTENRRLKECMIYDEDSGYSWELDEPLGNERHKELKARRRNGESYEEILQDMDVLK